MNRLIPLSVGLAVLVGCDNSSNTPPATPADVALNEEASAVAAPSPDESAPTAERAVENPAVPEPSPIIAPKTIPPITLEPGDNGTRLVVIDQAAYAEYCAAASLPEPPAPAEVDHVTFGLIHGANRTAATSGTNSALSRLAMMYDGNEMPARAIHCYRLLLERSPDDARWWHLLGRSLSIQGRDNEAVEAFGHARRLDSTNSATLIRLGNALLAIDRTDGAVVAFRNANQHLPVDKAALFGLARVAIEDEQWDEAHGFLQEVLAINGRFKPALQQMVIVQRSRGNLDDARQWAKRATSAPDGANTGPQDPLEQKMIRTSQSAAYYKSLMAALFKAGRYADAYDAVLQILKRQPDLALFQRNAASLAKLTGNLDAAIEHATRAVELNPQYAKGHTVLGELLRDAGRMDEAIAATAKAIELDPNDPTNHLSHGAVLVSAKQYDTALEQLDLGLAGAPNHITGLCLRVQCLAEMKRLDEAKATLERILALEPTNAWALQVKKQLGL